MTSQFEKNEEQIKPNLWMQLEAKYKRGKDDIGPSPAIGEVINRYPHPISPTAVIKILQLVPNTFPENWEVSKELSPDQKKAMARLEETLLGIPNVPYTIQSIIKAAKEAIG